MPRFEVDFTLTVPESLNLLPATYVNIAGARTGEPWGLRLWTPDSVAMTGASMSACSNFWRGCAVIMIWAFLSTISEPGSTWTSTQVPPRHFDVDGSFTSAAVKMPNVNRHWVTSRSVSGVPSS